MLNIDDINNMWAEDASINEYQLDEESRRTPILHAKYLAMRTKAYLALKKAEGDQKVLLRDKWLWFEGKLSQEEIKEKSWKFDPFDGLKKPLKGDMHYFYDADQDIQKSEQLIQYRKLILDTLDEIITNIKWRHQTIRNTIEWRKFEAGG